MKGGAQKMEQQAQDIHLPVKVTPYRHQCDAFAFVCRMFGLMPSDDQITSPGAALLMEMGTGKTITTIAIIGELYLSAGYPIRPCPGLPTLTKPQLPQQTLPERT